MVVIDYFNNFLYFKYITDKFSDNSHLTSTYNLNMNLILINNLIKSRINAVMGYNILRHKVSDAVNNNEEPLKEGKEKIDVEALIKQNEELQEQNQNLTVGFHFYLIHSVTKNTSVILLSSFE